MNLCYLLSGGAAVIKRYKIGSGAIIAGSPVLYASTGTSGVQVSTTTSVADCVGVVADTGNNYNVATGSGGALAYSTTQQSESLEGIFAIIINPDAVWRMLMNGGATNGTALAEKTVSTANSAGTTVNPSYNYSSPQMKDGIIWCTSGANVGQSRKITNSSSTTATVVVPFANTIAVGDTFCHAPYFHGGNAVSPTLQLTTTLDQADASIAVGTGATLTPVDLELNTKVDSYVQAMISDHMFAGSIT